MTAPAASLKTQTATALRLGFCVSGFMTGLLCQTGRPLDGQILNGNLLLRCP